MGNQKAMSQRQLISVRDRVMVAKSLNHGRKVYGTVKCVREVKGRTGIYYGIEADHANLDRDISKNGKVAFLKKKEIKLIKESTLLRVTVGDIVNVKSLKCRGVIRFIGPTKFKSNIIWYGIQLEEAKGKNNGSVDGVKYFQCYPKFGIFVKEEKIEIIERKKKKKMQ